MDFNLTVGNVGTEELLKLFRTTYKDFQVILAIVLIVAGCIGNTLSIIVWSQRRMLNSSGCYLVALAINDLCFLILYFFVYLQKEHNIDLLNIPVICQGFVVSYLTFQYLSPVLILGFTVERWISICRPFVKEKFCTVKRAIVVSFIMLFACLSINLIQGYFWIYENGQCTLRNETRTPGSTWNQYLLIHTWVAEMLIFGGVSLVSLIFNILVICEMCRLSKINQNPHKKPAKTSTFILLAVSFFQIFTTLPVAVVYGIAVTIDPGDPTLNLYQVPNDPTWNKYLDFMIMKSAIESIGLAHFACNFFIYITGKQFRSQCLRLIVRIVCRVQISLDPENEANVTYPYPRSPGSNVTKRLMALSNVYSNHDGSPQCSPLPTQKNRLKNSSPVTAENHNSLQISPLLTK